MEKVITEAILELDSRLSKITGEQIILGVL